MSRIGACLLAATLLAGCAAPQPVAGPTVTSGELAKAELGYYWQIPSELRPGERVAGLWQLEGILYCLTSENRVRAYDATAGTFLWQVSVGDSGQTVFPPCHGNQVMLPATPGHHQAVTRTPGAELKSYDVVVFNTVSYALVLDRSNGELLHRIDFSPLNLVANAGAATDGVYLYVVSSRGWYHAVDLVTGLAAWKLSTEQMVSARPVYQNRALYVASQDGKLHCTQTGMRPSLLWRHPAGAAFIGDFVVSEQGIFAGNLDYNVYCIDPITGKLSWRRLTGGTVTDPVQLGRTNVYAHPDNGRLYAIDAAKGTEKWTVPGGRLVLAEMGQDAMVLNDRNELLVVDAAGGQVKLAVPLTGLSRFVPNAQAPAIFAANDAGRLVCIRPRVAPPLTREMLGAAPRTAMSMPSRAAPSSAPSTQTAPAAP